MAVARFRPCLADRIRCLPRLVLLLSVAPAVLLAWLIWAEHGRAPADHLISIEQGVFVPQATPGKPVIRLLGWQEQDSAQDVRLPDDWRGRATGASGWYLFDIDLAVAPDRTWGVWLQRVAADARVFVNGVPLGAGLETDADFRNWNAPMLLRVANGLLEPGVNRIAVQVVADRPDHGFLGGVVLGPYAELLPVHERAMLVRIGALRVIVALMVVVGGFSALLWFWRRRDTVFGWFAAMTLAWAAHDIHPLLAHPLTMWPLLEWFWHATLVAFVYCVCLFVHRFLDQRYPAFERRLAIWAVAMPAVALPVAAFAPQIHHDWVAPISDTSALLISTLPFLMMGARLARLPSAVKAGMLAAGALPLLLGAHDWLVITGLLPRTHGYLMPYGSVLILLVFGSYLTRRFGRTLTDLEQLNQELEARVRAREVEIAVKHRRLQRLETERALLEERARLMTDMHDGLGGTLISTLAMVQAGQTNPDLLARALREAIDDLRLMIDSLDPVDGDLCSVLANMRARIEPKLRAAGLRLEWQVADVTTPAHLGSTGVLQVMRIVQESINNVLKHAHATRLRIALEAGPEPSGAQPLRRAAAAARRAALSIDEGPDGPDVDAPGPDAGDSRVEAVAPTGDRMGSIRVSITDDGIGLPHGTRSGGRGMGNMRRRAGRIGARLEVVPAEPGTRVLLEIPVHAPVGRRD